MSSLRLCITALVATGLAAQASAQSSPADDAPEPVLDPGEVYEPAPIEPIDPDATTLEPGEPPSYDDESFDDQRYDGSGDVDPNAAIAPIDDAVIESTLSPYGAWIQDPEYGRIWRPDPAYVGIDFTPYESCGSWIYTEYGWTFACEWDWGWLPFHYGQWDWFEPGYWGWVPDHTWSPAWVDWRYGDNYIGWQPARPIRSLRRGPTFRDHRRDLRDAHWTFTTRENFHRPRIRAHAVRNIREGLRTTAPVARPPIRGERSVGVQSVMQGRWRGARSPGVRQPDASRPDVRQPERREPPRVPERAPDVRQPDTRRPDMRRPDVPRVPERAPDVRQPDTRRPDMRRPDVRQPERREPPRVPDRAPDARQPDTRRPDVPRVPDRAPDVRRDTPRPPAARPERAREPSRSFTPPARPAPSPSFDRPARPAPSRSVTPPTPSMPPISRPAPVRTFDPPARSAPPPPARPAPSRPVTPPPSPPSSGGPAHSHGRR